MNFPVFWTGNIFAFYRYALIIGNW